MDNSKFEKEEQGYGCEMLKKAYMNYSEEETGGKSDNCSHNNIDKEKNKAMGMLMQYTLGCSCCLELSWKLVFLKTIPWDLKA